jgi:hypothetical protein
MGANQTRDSTSMDGQGRNENPDIHPSWNDEVLYPIKGDSSGKRIHKNEFELLAVIGKGSFAKVISRIIHAITQEECPFCGIISVKYKFCLEHILCTIRTR